MGRRHKRGSGCVETRRLRRHRTTRDTGRAANAAEAVALIDGSGQTAWKNAGTRDPLPCRFVFELRTPTVVERIGIIGAGPRPGGVAGGSARGIAIEGSATGPDKGFAPLGQLDARAQGETLLAVRGGAPVRWLRFTVASNHGSPMWTYWNEAVVQWAAGRVHRAEALHWRLPGRPQRSRGTEAAGFGADRVLLGTVGSYDRDDDG